LIPHLFRTEFSKITAVLCKLFGAEHMDVAEDIASETFMQAYETWSYKGLPPNPVAWLYTVARNKAHNYLVRRKTFLQKVAPQVRRTAQEHDEEDIDLSEKNITDSQLQMLFAICHPSIPREAQIGLALRILCGFGIEEIANAFLTNKETINKRLFRAKEKLRQERIAIAFPGKSETDARLDTVLKTLYLLFSEGYYSESNDAVLRKDLCVEAMRLTYMLACNDDTDRPEVNALLALMCFHSSRFEARRNSMGELVLYAEQDENLWDRELIGKGMEYMGKAASGNVLSRYHIEAAIAYWHTQKNDTEEKWQQILSLYDLLLQREYSAVAALNRIYALSKVNGNRAAIEAAEELRLEGNHFYHTLMGELHKYLDNSKAIGYLERALQLAKTSADKQTIQKQLEELRRIPVK